MIDEAFATGKSLVLLPRSMSREILESSLLSGQPWFKRPLLSSVRISGSFDTHVNLLTLSFPGTELIGVTVGEAQNPRKTIPKAIKLTFWRIIVFYVLSVLFVGMLVPYNSDDLAFATKAKSSAAASPFVVAMKQVAALPHIINACILVFVLSAANSDLYIATRTLYGLAREKKAPKIFCRTNQAGVPIFALALSASFCLLAFMSVSNGSKEVFGYFTDMVSIFGRMFYFPKTNNF